MGHPLGRDDRPGYRAAQGHASHVINVAFSPDGQAARHRQPRPDREGLGCRELPRALVSRAQADRINGVAFSPDGARLATASRDGTVALWEAATGRRWRPAGPPRFRRRRGVQPRRPPAGDGGWPALWTRPRGHAGEVMVWDVATGHAVLNIPGRDAFRLRRGVQPRWPITGIGRRRPSRSGLGCRHRLRAAHPARPR